MKIYKRYILRLLFLRFGTILLCTSVFGIFQEITKGQLIAVCTFGQAMLILPLMLPFILFQFLPFIYFGTLLLVHGELYLNNELVSFKTIGFSNQKLMNVFFNFAVFVLFFFVFLGTIYPAANRLFFKQRNIFGASNFLKSLKPLKINTIGKYKIFFNKIDKNGILYDVSVIYEDGDDVLVDGLSKKKTLTERPTGNDLLTKKSKNENLLTENKKILFSKTMSFCYNESDELIIQCIDSDILTLKFDNRSVTNILSKKTEDGGTGILLKQTEQIDNRAKQAVHAKQINILFDDFFQVDSGIKLQYKQRLRQLDIFSLIKAKTNIENQNKIKKTEIHGRVVVYWFVILSITALCGLFLKRQTNRGDSYKRLTMTVVIIGALISMSRAFVLDGIINNNAVLFFYYVVFVIIYIICVLYIKRSDLKMKKK